MKKIKLNALASLLFASTAAFAGIAGSPHDLSSATGDRSGLDTVTSDNGEICVYCHTPHAGNTDFATGGNAPLWNKLPVAAGAGTNTSFDMYSETIGGTAAATIVTNPSLACLSCHDGVSSIDSLVNSPGSGSGTSPTARLIGVVGGNTNADIGQLGVGEAGLAATHPISIVYGGPDLGGDNWVSGPASLRPKNADLETVSGAVWSGATTVGDLLRGATDMIECGSCHDPHLGGATRATEVNFLRVSNTGSQLCLGCHDK